MSLQFLETILPCAVMVVTLSLSGALPEAFEKVGGIYEEGRFEQTRQVQRGCNQLCNVVVFFVAHGRKHAFDEILRAQLSLTTCSHFYWSLDEKGVCREVSPTICFLLVHFEFFVATRVVLAFWIEPPKWTKIFAVPPLVWPKLSRFTFNLHVYDDFLLFCRNILDMVLKSGGNGASWTAFLIHVLLISHASTLKYLCSFLIYILLKPILKFKFLLIFNQRFRCLWTITDFLPRITDYGSSWVKICLKQIFVFHCWFSGWADNSVFFERLWGSGAGWQGRKDSCALCQQSFQFLFS